MGERDMSHEGKEPIAQQKDVAYYSALVSAWIQTKMERDKVLASLSAGGIALLVTLLSSIGIRHRWEMVLYVMAFISFLAAVGTCVWIFDRNSKHIQDVLERGAASDYLLKRLDKLSLLAFVAGAVFLMAIAVVTATGRLNEKGGLDMTDQERGEDKVQEVPLKESVDGIANLRPRREKPSDQAGTGQSVTAPDDAEASADSADQGGQ